MLAGPPLRYSSTARPSRVSAVRESSRSQAAAPSIISNVATSLGEPAGVGAVRTRSRISAGWVKGSIATRIQARHASTHSGISLARVRATCS